MQVIVVEPHISNYENPIFFKKGDKLQLGGVDTEYPNWIYITTYSGNSGWAPLQYMSVLSLKCGLALKDYDAIELNTVIGSILTVFFELNGWYRASNARNEVGWVPVKTTDVI